MVSLKPTTRLLMPVLIGALLVQGMVALTPHTHEVGTVFTVPNLADHWCSHDTQEAFPVAEVHGSAPCLACVIQTPAFAQPSHSPFVVRKASTGTESADPDCLPAPARRWHQQLRGPPTHA